MNLSLKTFCEKEKILVTHNVLKCFLSYGNFKSALCGKWLISRHTCILLVKE